MVIFLMLNSNKVFVYSVDIHLSITIKSLTYYEYNINPNENGHRIRKNARYILDLVKNKKMLVELREKASLRREAFFSDFKNIEAILNKNRKKSIRDIFKKKKHKTEEGIKLNKSMNTVETAETIHPQKNYFRHNEILPDQTNTKKRDLKPKAFISKKIMNRKKFFRDNTKEIIF